MPMVPEAAIAMLACARVGAIHSVVFAGFSSTSLADRIDDCEAKMVITSDGNFRGNKVIPVKPIVDEALEKSNSIEKVIVLNRTNQDVTLWKIDFWYELVADKSSDVKLKLWTQKICCSFYIPQVQLENLKVLSYNWKLYGIFSLYFFKCFSV